MARNMALQLTVRRAVSAFVIAGTCMGASAAMAQSTPSLDSAVAVSKKWSMLADTNQGDRMYRESGPLMKNSITTANWVKYLSDANSEYGAIRDRQFVQVIRVADPESLPKGEYMNVVFFTRYAQAQALETVSLAVSGSSWTPVGYVVRKIDPVAAAQPAPAAR